MSLPLGFRIEPGGDSDFEGSPVSRSLATTAKLPVNGKRSAILACCDGDRGGPASDDASTVAGSFAGSPCTGNRASQQAASEGEAMQEWLDRFFSETERCAQEPQPLIRSSRLAEKESPRTTRHRTVADGPLIYKGGIPCRSGCADIAGVFKRLHADAAERHWQDVCKSQQKEENLQPRRDKLVPPPDFSIDKLTSRLYQAEIDKRQKKVRDAELAEERRQEELVERERRKQQQVRPDVHLRLYNLKREMDQALESKRREQNQAERSRLASESVHKNIASDGEVFRRLCACSSRTQSAGSIDDAKSDPPSRGGVKPELIAQRLYQTWVDKKKEKEERDKLEEAQRKADELEKIRILRLQARPDIHIKLFNDGKERQEALIAKRRQFHEREESKIAAESVHKQMGDGSVFVRLASSSQPSVSTGAGNKHTPQRFFQKESCVPDAPAYHGRPLFAKPLLPADSTLEEKSAQQYTPRRPVPGFQTDEDECEDDDSQHPHSFEAARGVLEEKSELPLVSASASAGEDKFCGAGECEIAHASSYVVGDDFRDSDEETEQALGPNVQRLDVKQGDDQKVDREVSGCESEGDEYDENEECEEEEEEEGLEDEGEYDEDEAEDGDEEEEEELRDGGDDLDEFGECF